jgi:AraC-like DNA-binding protein
VDPPMRSHFAPTMIVIKQRFRRPLQAEGGPRLRPFFDDFHLLRMEGEYEYPRHQHTNYELILVEHGPYRCELNGVELALADGQVLVIKPGDWHQDHLGHGQRHYVLHFRVPDLESVGLFKSDISPELQIGRGDHFHDALFLRELRREAELAATYAPAIQDSLLEALFWRVVRDLPQQGLTELIRRLPRREALREQIVAVLHRRLRDNPTVRALAAEAKMSPRHLTNLCQRLFGQPPARLLLQLKLRHAEEMLRFRGMRVKEVSEELGFANPYHFSRVFRRHRGRAPSLA